MHNQLLPSARVASGDPTARGKNAAAPAQLAPSALPAGPLGQPPRFRREAEGETLNDVPSDQSARLVPEALHPLEQAGRGISDRRELLSRSCLGKARPTRSSAGRAP